MTDIEYIKELDKRLEKVNELIASQTAEVLNKKLSKKAQNKELADISARYANVTAEILLEREEAYSREYARQQADYENQFIEKPQQKTKAFSKIRKNGEWVDRE